jgi:hypothetical protein
MPRRIVPTTDFVGRGVTFAAEAAPVPHLKYHDGPLLGAVDVVPIYWGAAWSTDPNASFARDLDAFFDFIVTSQMMEMLAEYSTASTRIGHVHDPAFAAALRTVWGEDG